MRGSRVVLIIVGLAVGVACANPGDPGNGARADAAPGGDGAGSPDSDDPSCPGTCDDGDPCTTDTRDGDSCPRVCVHGPIEAPGDGDGCCPAGANVHSDDDCPAGCGNGVIERGEACDTGISAGQPGACPASCGDGQACTADALSGSGCQAACVFTPITEASPGDGCCPAFAWSELDRNCSSGCGDGVVAEGETCDTEIAPGSPGACPSACPDGDPCTVDVLLSAETCQAVCVHRAIVRVSDADGCCPPAIGNADNDSDCAPVCGNEVIEGGEGCDPPGPDCTSACQRPPTALRFDAVELLDPHLYLDSSECGDMTELANALIGMALASDDGTPADGLLDLSLLQVFRPLDPPAATTALDVVVGAHCSAPAASTTCTAEGATSVASTATNRGDGVCLAPVAGTTNASYTPVSAPAAAPRCFASDAETLAIPLGGFILTLDEARTAGVYVGVPATQIADGLVMGFVSESAARATVLPVDTPLVGGRALSDLLGGGTGSCGAMIPDDRDTGPGGERGWYFYLRYGAHKVPYTP